MSTYVAFTSTDPRLGWHVILEGKDGEPKSSVIDRALAKIVGPVSAEMAMPEVTELRNLTVLARSIAKRSTPYRRAIARWEESLLQDVEE